MLGHPNFYLLADDFLDWTNAPLHLFYFHHGLLGIHHYLGVGLDQLLAFEGTNGILKLNDVLSGKSPEVFGVLTPFHNALFLKMFKVGPGVPFPKAFLTGYLISEFSRDLYQRLRCFCHNLPWFWLFNGSLLRWNLLRL